MVVPLDLVKCRLQVDPAKYKSVFTGFRISLAEEGVRGLAKGWAPTFIGYSMQGLCKFGLYEVFKKVYGDAIGEENAFLYRTGLYLAASASAEFFADIALAPMEAAKVKIQTTPGFAKTLREALPKMTAQEGVTAFYKGLVPLWMRQIPYTMMKFACFERTLELLYKYVVPKPRADCTKGEQLVHARIRQDIARGSAQDDRPGGRDRLLQGPGAIVDAPDPIHHDEVRLLRADAGAAVQVCGAQATCRLHQG